MKRLKVSPLSPINYGFSLNTATYHSGDKFLALGHITSLGTM
jgi:hypothetical protein